MPQRDAPSPASLARAAAARARFLRELPPSYDPRRHLLIPNIYGGLLITACLTLLHDSGQDAPGLAQWSVLPAVLVLGQGVEWSFHRHLLHRRVKPLHYLYDAHHVSHHTLYVRGAMPIRELRELRGVLFPWWGIVVLTLLMTPLALALAACFGRDVGLLFMIATHAYMLVYEWLHTAYHLPTTHPLHRAVAWLAAHHELHHDPALMTRANFGVTTPLWDILRGTRLRGTRRH